VCFRFLFDSHPGAATGRRIGWARAGDERPKHGGKHGQQNENIDAVAGFAGLSALIQLLFVITKLPVIFWPDLLGGIIAALITAIVVVFLRRHLPRPV
jgi:hypothetical protein